MALQPWITGTVIRIADHTPTTRQFWIEVPSLSVFDFKPGQFVTLDLPKNLISVGAVIRLRPDPMEPMFLS
jgi:ferredoxin-NADP reductase